MILTLRESGHPFFFQRNECFSPRSFKSKGGGGTSMHRNTGLTTVGHIHPSLLRLVLFCVDRIQYSILGFVVSDIARRILLLVISKVCALSCVSKLQRDTTSLVKGIAIETFRTKYKGPSCIRDPRIWLTKDGKNERSLPYLTSWLIWLQ